MGCVHSISHIGSDGRQQHRLVEHVSRTACETIQVDELVREKSISPTCTVSAKRQAAVAAIPKAALHATEKPKSQSSDKNGMDRDFIASAQQSSMSADSKRCSGGSKRGFELLQTSLSIDVPFIPEVTTKAAAVKHIGFGPLKKENQDEFYVRVGGFGGQDYCNLFCVLDGHGSNGRGAAAFCRQELPRLLDGHLRTAAQNSQVPEEDKKMDVELMIKDSFETAERNMEQTGINVSSSGTTASLVLQQGNRIWVAAAGDSRVILCSRKSKCWRAQPLTIDHRPRRNSERIRVEAAGARVEPKRLSTGRSVGEPRLWLQNVASPGLLLSRSLGDIMAASIGCTATPEVVYTTLRPDIDHFIVLASDGVWDVLTNEQVCEIVSGAGEPQAACRAVLDASLVEWEERMTSDNITIVVVRLFWAPPNAAGSHTPVEAMDVDAQSAGEAAGPGPRTPPLDGAAASGAGAGRSRSADEVWVTADTQGSGMECGPDAWASTSLAEGPAALAGGVEDGGGDPNRGSLKARTKSKAVLWREQMQRGRTGRTLDVTPEAQRTSAVRQEDNEGQRDPM